MNRAVRLVCVLSEIEQDDDEKGKEQGDRFDPEFGNEYVL